MAAKYLYARVASFLVAPKVHKQRPFYKLMGPVMHVPFYLLVPASYVWLVNERKTLTSADSVSSKDVVQYWFIWYTTIITSISLLSDTKVMVKYLLGHDVGEYPREDAKKK